MKKFPSFKNKKILILGLGLLGRGIKDAIFFAEKGADVRITDLKTADQLKESLEKLKKYNFKFTLGEHKEQDILEADLIIRNAAVPASSEFLKFAKKKKIPVDMDESLFAEYCPCPIIGITGTRGKSTTTALIGKILQNNLEFLKRKNVYVAGNIKGEATLPLIDKVTKDDLVVLELSSWQLQGFGRKKISPHISIVTNIYPDHLNSYKNMREYANDKKFIFLFQKKKDFCILNEKNPYTKKMGPEVKSKLIWFSKKDVPKNWKLTMLGKHNLENASSAMAVGKILGLSKKQMQSSISEFPGLEHRLEFVKKLNNVNFINDTTSTTPIAGQKALEAIPGPIILIAGGASKNLILKDFAKTIVKKAKSVILLDGNATDALERDIKYFGGDHLIIGRFNDFNEAVTRAYDHSLPGDTILLSPGCASFGLFVNEFDRGEQFKKIVNKLQ
ncbi:UDP-N-acetylmuramoyl-L-alanine--D-glutamate ligase [Patescibacteria group bacterium]|nr:UDP-N-acetylmuramoyl-L-alanine--D-glutamate ligase [Patescibacteria group bacterium]